MTEARAYVTLDELLHLRHRAKGFSFLPRQPVHSLLTGRHASRLRGRGLDFEELRHYAEGDDTRAMDWAATARLGTPHLRVYTEERDRNVLLLVDQRQSMFFGSRLAMKSVVAAEAAALSAFRVASLGDRIGAIVFSEAGGVVEIKPQAREAGVQRILAEVVRHNRLLSAATEKPSDPALLNEALRRAVLLAHHDWLIVLISDTTGADAESVKQVTRLTAHNDALSVFISDPLEAELPDIGNAVLADGSHQIEVDLSARDLRRQFAAGFAERRTNAARFSLQRAIPVLPLVTGRDVSDQFREQLGRRLSRRPAA
ncbi:DUF58 domain-containing protein [Reyranella sp.]|uniref:DUF58 domain-containing protein n=1 Tax=Reyranella sp. TaxID=1929291 RepID=UPI0012250640|nr:DUF58 domain-containing protein [Reyranella sp.]TAJ87399.1 MAG: DUF58 domain-containing protein [Reyranella sp.]